MTSYQQALDWLYALEAAKGMDFKLERVALALEHLGNPQRAFANIHIAGTNGKGSVAATLHAVLSAAGYRVGLYTSPHLERLNERIRIGAGDIGDDEIVELTGEIQREVTSRRIELTFFELVTVMAFLSFARHGVEAAVVETGLGGRLDATNVLDPLAAVITNIGYDHSEFLGNTLAEIASEKGGIIKPGRPVVLGPMRPAAARVLRRIASDRGAAVFEVGRGDRQVEGKLLELIGSASTVAGASLALRGDFQRENALTALTTLAAVAERFPVGDAALRRGLREVRWPGRFEVIDGAPQIVLDGAHNVDGMAALLREIESFAGAKQVHAVFAVMRDKPWRRMIDLLGPRCASATVTQVLPPRGLAAADAARAFARHCPAVVEPDPLRAVARARQSAACGDVVLVVGSLFLIGAVGAHCRRGMTEPVSARV